MSELKIKRGGLGFEKGLFRKRVLKALFFKVGESLREYATAFEGNTILFQIQNNPFSNSKQPFFKFKIALFQFQDYPFPS